MGDEDRLDSVICSINDKENVHLKHKQFMFETNISNSTFAIGMLFAIINDFEKTIKEYGIKYHEKSLKFVKNNKNKVRVVYAINDCKWLLFVPQVFKW